MAPKELMHTEYKKVVVRLSPDYKKKWGTFYAKVTPRPATD